MARLSDYGGQIITIDGQRVVQLVDPNDGAQRRFQYRLAPGPQRQIERRVLAHDGQPFRDTGSPWEPMTDTEYRALLSVRGDYHPILDGLGQEEEDTMDATSYGIIYGRDGANFPDIAEDGPYATLADARASIDRERVRDMGGAVIASGWVESDGLDIATGAGTVVEVIDAREED